MIDGPLDRYGVPSGPPSFPRTYRISKGWRLVGFGCGALFLAFAIGAFVGSILDPGPTVAATTVIVVIGVGFGIAGAAAIADTLLYRVVVNHTSIERTGLFRRRRLARSEIRGRRLRHEQYGPSTLILVPAAGKPLKLYGSLARDAAFNGWIDPIPDLDAEDAQRALDEVQADERLGRDPEERLARIAGAGKVANALNLVSFGVMIWVWRYPFPYFLAIATAAALPLVALGLMVSRPATFNTGFENHEGKYPTLFGPLCIPGFALALRAFIDVDWVDLKEPLIVTAACALALALLATLLHSGIRRKPWMALLLLFFTAPYVYGILALGDTMFDRSAPQAFATYLRDKHVQTGKYTTWEIYIDPWASTESTSTLLVPKPFYDAVKPGDRVTVLKMDGAFGFSWFIPLTCNSGYLRHTVGPLRRLLDGEIAYQCQRFEIIPQILGELVSAGNRDAELLVGLAHWEQRSPIHDPAEAMRLLKLSAAHGDARAMNVIGYSYEYGLGVPADLGEARHWYEAAAERGERRALNNLAIVYDEGRGVAKDSARARELWLRAAALYHPSAMNNLGKMYAEGDGVTPDMAEAIRWWRSAAERGNEVSQVVLAREYLSGTHVTADPAQAAVLLRRAAERGYAPALHLLGNLYATGHGVARDDAEAKRWLAAAFSAGDLTAALDASGIAHASRDYSEAARWLEAAAGRGLPRAQALLGQRYLSGIGVAQDDVAALRWYQSAADQGDVYGEFMIGEVYDLGAPHYVPDKETAATWYLRAAERGLAAAQYRMGLLIATGQLVVRDYAKAADWFRRAAEQEYPDAMNSWAFTLDAGMGVAVDQKEALVWYRRAVDYGQPNAMHSLAAHYLSGTGVSADTGEAYYWLLLAKRFYAERDPGKRVQVEQMLSGLEPRLDSGAKATAEVRASVFAPKALPPLEGARPRPQASNAP